MAPKRATKKAATGTKRKAKAAPEEVEEPAATAVKTAETKDAKEAAAPAAAAAAAPAAVPVATAAAPAPSAAEADAKDSKAAAAPASAAAGDREFSCDDVMWPWMHFSRFGSGSWLTPAKEPRERIRFRADGQMVHDAFPCADGTNEDLAAACADIQKQIRLWGPAPRGEDDGDGSDASDWSVVYVPRALLEKAGLAPGASVEQCITTLFDVPNRNKPDAKPNDHPPVTIRATKCLHSRKTFVPQSFYWVGDRIDNKKLAKVKAGTTKLMKATVKDSNWILKFENEDTNFYGWGVMVAGWAKKADHSLIILTYQDGSEAHTYHGK